MVFEDDDSEDGEEIKMSGPTPESQPKNPEKVKGLQTVAKMNKKLEKKKLAKEKPVVEEMTPAQLKVKREEKRER